MWRILPPSEVAGAEVTERWGWRQGDGLLQSRSLDGSIWSGLSGKGLDRRSNIVERNGRFGRLKMCRFFLRETSENTKKQKTNR